MRQWIGILAMVSSVCTGCQNPRKQVIERIDADSQIIGRASAAVNEVIRNSPDCDIAKPLLAEAYQRIDEARRQIRVAANRQLLETMKTQVDRVAQACP
jgi:hypothetical protein